MPSAFYIHHPIHSPLHIPKTPTALILLDIDLGQEVYMLKQLPGTTYTFRDIIEPDYLYGDKTHGI